MPETSKKSVIASNAKQSSAVKLDKSIFDVPVKNHELLKLAYESYLAEGRQVGAKTLRRGEVRGGGKKPWRQKGTGRARFGSSRNPIWRGGGVAFGPLGIENYRVKITKSAKHVALRQALTLANQAKKIIIALEPDIKSGKTRDAVKLLTKYGVADKKRVLGVVAEKTDGTMRAVSNLPNVEIVSAKYLTVYHILNADAILFGPAALQVVTEWLKPKGDK